MGYVIGSKTDTSFTSADITAGRGAGLGDVSTAANGDEFVFVQAAANVSASFVLTVDDAYQATHITTTNAQASANAFVAISPVNALSAEYFWAQIKGKCTIFTAAAAVAGLDLYTTGTAGKVDDAVTSAHIHGLHLNQTTAGSASATTAYAVFPWVSVGGGG